MIQIEDSVVIARLQHSIKSLARTNRQTKFFTNGLVIKHYRACFPDNELPNWYLRAFLKQPHFRLDDTLGWRNYILISKG
jgi:hypothetical protein